MSHGLLSHLEDRACTDKNTRACHQRRNNDAGRESHRTDSATGTRLSCRCAHSFSQQSNLMLHVVTHEETGEEVVPAAEVEALDDPAILLAEDEAVDAGPAQW